MKKYIAKTNVSVNVVLSNGKNRHITFSPLTGGGSVYYTDDADIIEALERHYKCGTLFRIDSRFEEEKPRIRQTCKQKAAEKPVKPEAIDKPVEAEQSEKPVAAEAAKDSEHPENSEDSENSEVAEEAEGTEDTDADGGLKTIVVSDPDAAKAYLAEHFSYSRTKLKSLKAIKEAAVANGIVFEGI